MQAAALGVMSIEGIIKAITATLSLSIERPDELLLSTIELSTCTIFGENWLLLIPADTMIARPKVDPFCDVKL